MFLERTPGYWREPLEDIQLMDIGISMCNFDCTAEEAGINGKWETGVVLKAKDGWEYVATWHSSLCSGSWQACII